MDVTREDVRELREDLSDQIRSGFDRQDRALEGINEHLRLLNGKVATQAAAIAVHENRWLSNGLEMRDVKASLKDVAGKVDGATKDTRFGLKELVLIVLGTITGTVGVLKFFQVIVR